MNLPSSSEMSSCFGELIACSFSERTMSRRTPGNERATRLTRSGKGHAELHPLKYVALERMGEVPVLDYERSQKSTPRGARTLDSPHVMVFVAKSSFHFAGTS